MSVMHHEATKSRKLCMVHIPPEESEGRSLQADH